MSSIIATQAEQIQKLGEFGPLVRAAKGELVGRLNTNDTLADVLKSAKLELEQENDSVVGGRRRKMNLAVADNNDVI